MPLPYDFEGKGSLREREFLFCEPNSVLDNNNSNTNNISLSSPSNSTSTSTISGQIQAVAPAPKCAGATMEGWENQDQEQNILRWIMGDVEDPSMGINKLLQNPNGNSNNNTNCNTNLGELGFGTYGGGAEQVFAIDQVDNFAQLGNPFSPFPGFVQKPNLGAFGPQMVINNHQVLPQQNPQFFIPGNEQNLFLPPSKRVNHGGQAEFESPRGFPHFLGPNTKQKVMGGEENGQQAIIDQIYKAAELIQTGNSVLAQGILARLNHHISSPTGKPFYRASYFCKEALQLLMNPNSSILSTNSTPFNLILKIGAFKSFSEISPLLQFANFTCNQAILEAVEGFDRIHIVDFDISYGGQWASLMQELALRENGPPSVKITAFASPLTHDQLELGLTRENLIHFSGEINMPFEFEILNLDLLSSSSWSLPFHCSDNEAIVVNLPINSFAIYQLPLPLIINFVKQLLPKIVVSTDRGSDRTDLPFPNHVIHALQSYSNLLESLDAVNVNVDALQKIERFLFQPAIEKIVMGRYQSPEKTPHWRTVFLSSGLSPLAFSNITESQADCLVKRTPVRGFHVEKTQSSLVLCWQRKELVSASAWRF